MQYYLNRLLKILNSPFTITVIGGVILSVLAAYFQWTLTENELIQTKKQWSYEQKKEVLKDFSGNIVHSVSVAYMYKIREVWIVENINNKTALFSDGRSYVETRNKYELLLESYLKGPTPEMLMYRILADYKSPRVIDLANKLLVEVNLMIDAKGDRAMHMVRESYKKLNILYQPLIAEMTKELIVNEPKQEERM